MANDKRFVVENGLQTENIEYLSPDGTKSILVSLSNTGALTYVGTNGQLFAITDEATGSIFSVNDISGIPSIEVDLNGNIFLAESTGNVGIGTNTPAGKLSVNTGTTTSYTTTPGNVGVWDSTYSLFGAANSTTGAAIGIGMTSIGGVISSLQPSIAWKDLYFNANNYYWYHGTGQLLSLDSSGNISILGNIVDASNTGFTLKPSGTSTFNTLNVSAILSVSGGRIDLGNATSNYILYNNAGVAPPATTTRSAGTKLVYWGSLSSTAVDYATGIDNSTLWTSIPSNVSSNYFKWYAGTTLVGWLDGVGTATYASSIRAPIFYDSANTSYYVQPSSTSNVNNLYLSTLNINGPNTNNLALSLPSNNPENGPYNPIIASIRASGNSQYYDEDFNDGFNSVSVYNNAGGNGVTITRVTASSVSLNAPNSSGYVLQIAYLTGSTNGTSPGLGGFILQINSAPNQTFVQIFKALIPVGYQVNIAENAQGSNNTSYWLTSQAGTGKWEWYARISHCGNTGTFSSGGHVYLSGSTATSINWYLASANVYNISDASALTTRSLFAANKLQAPIFYDSNNTAYYVDPASISNISQLVLPYYSGGTGTNTLQIGATSDFGTNNFELGIALPSGGTHWPFGFTKAGTVLASIDYNGNQALGGSLVASGTVQSNTSLNAPIFYDTNNTAYYVDPASISLQYQLTNAGTLGTSATNARNHFTQFNAGSAAISTGWIAAAFGDASADRVVIGQGTGSFPTSAIIGAHNGNLNAWGSLTIASATTYFSNTSYTNIGSIDGSGNFTSIGSLKSPIFYDYNNTGYYVDPASTSNLNSVTMAGSITARTPTVASALSSANTGSIEIPDPSPANSGDNYITGYHQTSTLAGYGYRQHLSIGQYRPANGAWGYTFIGVGGNDAYPTVAYLFHYGGTFTSPGDVVAYSDRRVKEDIEIIPDALSKVKKLSGYTYRRTDLPGQEGIRHTGVIAQEVLEVLPEAVSNVDDKYSVAYGNMVGLLIEAIKEQDEKINKQQEQIDWLIKKIQYLEK